MYLYHKRTTITFLSKLKKKPLKYMTNMYTQFTVYQQYPREIYERRRNLIPKMKELKRQKHTVKLVYDKLIVDGHPYNPRNDPHPGNQDNTSDVNIGHVSDNVNKLNITFLNVCGIKSKLLNPDFDLLIKSYDVLIFTETKTDEFDELKLPEEYILQNTEKKIIKMQAG